MMRAISVVTLCAAAALMLVAPPAQALVGKRFTYTGGEQTFTVPDGVHRIKMAAAGGAGGDTADATGGEGAVVAGAALVTPEQTLYLEVGGAGKSQAEGGAGGFNGGGSAAANSGGGGGGPSDIRTSPRADGLSPDTRFIIAAGGGGAGGSGPEIGGEGANGGDASEAGETSTGGNGGGGEGKPLEGGLAGLPSCGGVSEAGALGLGGAGSSGEAGTNGGGGGGGGLYGGGGGGGGCSFGGGGGGGGSSFVAGGGFVILNTEEPAVEIAYSNPPAIDIASPIAGATVTQGQALTAAYTCDPEGSISLVSCTGTVANGAALDTSTLGPHTLAVEAVDVLEGESSKSATYTVVAPASAALPNTTISAHPKKTVKSKKKKVKVKFSFSSDLPGTTFQCKLDRGAFTACTSPKSYRVKPGKHTFSVEAVSPAGTDATPATFGFKDKKKT